MQVRRERNRRSAIRVRRADGTKELAHTLNGTAVAIGRTMSAIFEQHQRSDGRIEIPDVLKPYMMGRDVIGKPLREQIGRSLSFDR